MLVRRQLKQKADLSVLMKISDELNVPVEYFLANDEESHEQGDADLF